MPTNEVWAEYFELLKRHLERLQEKGNALVAQLGREPALDPQIRTQLEDVLQEIEELAKIRPPE